MDSCFQICSAFKIDSFQHMPTIFPFISPSISVVQALHAHFHAVKFSSFASSLLIHKRNISKLGGLPGL